jgi:Domain of unknown function (DUF5916)/Carbohydrate family 9 binding domain-like
MNLRALSLFLLFSCLTLVATAQQGTNPERSYNISKTTEPINIDGILSESIWSKVPVTEGFWMSYPVDDRVADEHMQTEVRMASDDQYLYISAVCFGPEDYVIKTLKRDKEFWDGDGFGVVIDPVNEQTNGFVFGINPAGVQTEYLVTGQTGRRSEPEPGQTLKGFNVAWDNKWFSEVTSHPDKWVVEIAIPFKTLRFDEDKSNWGINFFRRDAASNTVHTWAPVPIEFFETELGYTGTLAWEVSPKKAARNLAIIPYARGGVARDYEAGTDTDILYQAGVDAKVPVTSSLSLDLTVNPDFSQVEVDEQVINLTLFDVQLPEKRLFFLENSDIFEDFGIPPMRPFFSRRIGLDEDGNAIPILYGARLSGNVNKNLRMGVMNLQTRESGDFLPQNYTVASFHQQVFERSVIKAYFQNRDALRGETPDYNRVGGLEFQYRSGDGRFQSFGGYSKAFSPGLEKKNYFYNTGIGYDNKNLSVYSNLSGLGKNYRSDMGYIRGQEYYDAERDTSVHIGMNHWFTRGSYTFYPEDNERIISHEINGRYIYDGDTTFSLLNSEGEVGYSLKFATTAQLEASVNHSVVNLLFPFTFINDEPLPAGIYRYHQAEIGIQSDQRRLFSLMGGMAYGSFFNGTRIQYRLGIKYRAQPWGNFSINLEQNKLDFPDPYGSDNLLLINPRIEINFSRSLFWTTFLQYNTQEDNFNINSRLQWRFQPMSDLYIVYTDNYAVEFWGPKHRALVIKLNYWFNL